MNYGIVTGYPVKKYSKTRASMSQTVNFTPLYTWDENCTATVSLFAIRRSARITGT
jgi:hypothetical protein